MKRVAWWVVATALFVSNYLAAEALEEQGSAQPLQLPGSGGAFGSGGSASGGSASGGSASGGSASGGVFGSGGTR